MYNLNSLICPVTSKVKGYPLEVERTGVKNLKGVVLAGQLKSIDWRIRKAELIAKAKPQVINEVVALIDTLINI